MPMEVDKTDIEWLIMMIVMLLQKFPIEITITIKKKGKPSKKRKRKGKKHKR